jgi:hypothetical protein
MTNNRYHPLVILLYHSNMLSIKQIENIPRSTRYRWDKFEHQDYYGTEWADSYVNQFEQIKQVYARKNLYRTVKFLCTMSQGFENIMDGVQSKNKVLRENAIQFTRSIKQFSKLSRQPISKVLRLFGSNNDWYYRNREKQGCKISPIDKCYKQHPSQLTIEEVNIIENALNIPENRRKTKVSVYYQLLDQGKFFCSLSTFMKYARFFRDNYKKPKNKKKSSSFNATKPFEWLHIDIMLVPTTEDGFQKVAFVKDNYSKAILNSSTTDGKAGSLFIKNLLEDTYLAYDMYNLKHDINIVSDGGSENKGLVLDWMDEIQTPPVVRKLTANTDEFPFCNNMSESTHRIYKSEFLRGKMTQNKLEHLRNIKDFMIYYGHERYPSDHYGLTVTEVLNGEIPDKHKYQKEIRAAQLERYQFNINFNQCPTMTELVF